MNRDFLVHDSAVRALKHWPGLAVYELRYPPDRAHQLASLIDSHGLEQCLWVLDHLSGECATRARIAFAAWCVDRGIRSFESTCPVDGRARDAVFAARRWVTSPTGEYQHAAAVALLDAWRASRACSQVGALLAKAATHIMDESRSTAALVRSAFAQRGTCAWHGELEVQIGGLRNLLSGRDP
ncbi:MAG: hypothetical protein V4558_14880 [Gemmatimonadota bacterium]